jgi:cytochrome c6
MKRKSSLWLILILAAALVVPVALRSKEENKPSAPGDATAGEALFKKNCQLCHHPDKSTKKLGPGLKDLFSLKELPESKKPLSEEVIREQIVNGTKNMPAFGKKLSPEQIDNLIAYLKTI